MAEVPIQMWSRPSQPKGGAGRQNHIEGITPETWFSPLDPLPDFAPQDVAGRQWDYPVGYNLLVTPRPLEKTTFKTLRTLVDKCDIIQVIINNRKDQTESKSWTIRKKEDAALPKAKKIEPDDTVMMLTEFFNKPDKVNTWDAWLRPWLDDLFVLDAPTVYVRRNKAGGVYSLEVMDGATVALNVDQNGRRPLPPSPAFKQILKGVPAISYTINDIIYSPRNMKTWGIYGRSPVEQTMVTINAAINRAIFNQNYYTEGNIPDAIASLPDTFTPMQAKQFTEWWDAEHSGNLSQKRKVKFVPGLQSFEQLKEPELKNVYDDYIARILCFALGISPQPFISQMNRATAEVSKVSTDEEGKKPVENMIKNLVNKVIQEPMFFNLPAYEMVWEEKDDTDPAVQATTLTTYTSKALMTINESREKIGLEHDPNPICDELGIITSTGFVTLKQSEEQAKATLEQIKNPPEMGDTGGAGTDKEDKTSKSLGASSTQLIKKKSKIHTILDRPTVIAAKKRVVKAVLSVLHQTAASVERQLKRKLKKDDDVEPGSVDLDIELSELENIDSAVKSELETIAGESGAIILGKLDLAEQGLVNQVNKRATVWAADRSAELVTLVTDSTRAEIKRILSAGLEDNIGRDEIIADLGSLFSEDRAALIADTEIGFANSQGSLLGLQEAEDAGVTVKKEWDATDEPCPICQENEDAGPIPLEESFPSGDDTPLAHPNCRCVLLGVTSD